MGAAPIIAAAVGVAATGAQIASQNAAAARQNRAIDAQISANKDAERIRQRQNDFQRGVIRQQSRVENQARRQAFREELRVIRDADRQQRFSTASQLLNLDTQLDAFNNQSRLELNAGLSQLELDRAGFMSQNNQERGRLLTQLQTDQLEQQFQSEKSALDRQQQTNSLLNNTVEQVTSTMGEAANVSSQLANNAQQLTAESENNTRQLSNNAAQMRGMFGGGQTTDTASRITPAQIADSMSQLLQQRGLSAELAQSVVESEEYANTISQIAEEQNALDEQLRSLELDALNREIVGQQRAINESTNLSNRQARQSTEQQRRFLIDNTNRDLGFANNNTGILSQIINNQRESFRRQSELARRSTRLGRRIGNRQAGIDRIFAEASLVTGAGLNQAQSAQQRAVLESQRAQRTPLISQIGQIGSSLVPLAGALSQSGLFNSTSTPDAPNTALLPGTMNPIALRSPSILQG